MVLPIMLSFTCTCTCIKLLVVVVSNQTSTILSFLAYAERVNIRSMSQMFERSKKTFHSIWLQREKEEKLWELIFRLGPFSCDYFFFLFVSFCSRLCRLSLFAAKVTFLIFFLPLLLISFHFMSSAFNLDAFVDKMLQLYQKHTLDVDILLWN